MLEHDDDMGTAIEEVMFLQKKATRAQALREFNVLAGTAYEPAPPATMTAVAQAVDRIVGARAELFTPIEYVLDGFVMCGVFVIAGQPGVGKTNALVSLAACVAHVAPKDWGLWPVLRRRVVFITEAVNQTLNVRSSLMLKALNARTVTQADIDYWFQVRDSKRVPAADRAADLKRIVAEYTIAGPNGYRVKPLVVLDTTSSTIDLENENDNAEVSRAVSAVREASEDGPVWLNTHTAKTMSRQTVSARGASAWEGDTSGSAYMIRDGDHDTAPRVLLLGKVRHVPAFNELQFGYDQGEVQLKTPWGAEQTLRFGHGVPARSDTQVRRREQASQTENRLIEAAVDAARRAVDGAVFLTKSELIDGMRLGRSNGQKRAAVGAAIVAGFLRVIPMPQSHRTHANKKEAIVPGDWNEVPK